MMATTMSSPCCGDEEQTGGGETAQVRPERCCTRITIAVERAPSDLTPKTDEALLPLQTVPVAMALAAPPTIVPLARICARSEGPPIILQVCSLLI
jgi:hypothetical protein